MEHREPKQGERDEERIRVLLREGAVNYRWLVFLLVVMVPLAFSLEQGWGAWKWAAAGVASAVLIQWLSWFGVCLACLHGLAVVALGLVRMNEAGHTTPASAGIVLAGGLVVAVVATSRTLHVWLAHRRDELDPADAREPEQLVPMERLFMTPRLHEASLTQAALEGEGIRAVVRNPENALGAYYLTALLDGQVELWVERDRLDESRAFIRSRHVSKVSEGPPSSCPACREDNPANFETCWSCAGDLHPGEDATAS